MHFVSLHFLAFVAIVLGGYYAWQPARRFERQNSWLLLASYAFYVWFSWTYALALLIATLVNHEIAFRLRDLENPRRKRWLRVGLAFNLGLLGLFKYLGFFADSAAAFLSILGMDMSWSFEFLWLPLGISFFTFQNLGYLLDVYKRSIEPVESRRDFALFVAFFPQLVMGPIERAAHLLPQIQAPRTPTTEDFRCGAWLVFLGITKKIVVADPLGRLVDPLFPAHTGDTTYLSGHVAAGALLFMLQIYVDFSSYTDIARGCGRMFGFELTRNFRAPYLADNLREFWARWHITLSSWINDYLYAWLAVQPRWNRFLGARGILIVTMMVMGIWHGASWVFVAWGFYHGVLLVIYQRFRPFLHRHSRFDTITGRRMWKTACILATFSVVTLGELLFRPESLEQSIAMFRGLLTNPGMTASTMASLLTGIRLYTLILALDILEHRRGDDETIFHLPWPWRRLIQFGMCYLLVQSFAAHPEATGEDFHYFRF